jgi:hypothetical protein
MGERTGNYARSDRDGRESNEITAIPQLLDQIDLQNSIVTIDAMGCQKKIVEQIDIVHWPWLGQLLTG